MPRPEIRSELCDKIKKSGLNVYLGRIYKSGYESRYEFLDIKLADQAIEWFKDTFSENCNDISSKNQADIIRRPDPDKMNGKPRPEGRGSSYPPNINPMRTFFIF